jgi:hypothetical protein
MYRNWIVGFKHRCVCDLSPLWTVDGECAKMEQVIRRAWKSGEEACGKVRCFRNFLQQC